MTLTNNGTITNLTNTFDIIDLTNTLNGKIYRIVNEGIIGEDKTDSKCSESTDYDYAIYNDAKG